MINQYNTGGFILFNHNVESEGQLVNLTRAIQSHSIKELGLPVKSRPVEIGYEIRSCHPTAYDMNYCTMLGMGVKKLFDEGCSGCIVVAKANGEFSPLYLKDITDSKTEKVKTRLVDVDAQDYQLAFSNLHYLKEKLALY